MSQLQHIEQLLQEAGAQALYKQLVKQLQKDFMLANITTEIHKNISPEALKELLFEEIGMLINNDFDQFLNLIYRIDVSEAKLKRSPKDSMQEYIAYVVYLILKREWQKVWFKNTL